MPTPQVLSPMATKTQKKKVEAFVTPRFVAKYPRLSAPDTEYKKEGEYHVKGIFDPLNDKTVQPFLDKLQDAFDTYVEEVKAEVGPAKAKKLKVQEPFQMEEDEEGNETGKVLVKFGTAASFEKDGKTVEKKLKVFDSRGNPLTPVPNIGSGSVLKVSYTIGTYNTPQATGIKCYLNAVQVIELVEFGGGGNAESYGFGTEADGFTANPEGFDNEEENASAGDDF